MPKPTTAPPGSPEKLAVLRGRWERGEYLWHPQDPRIEWEFATMQCESISLNETWAAIRDNELRYAEEE